MKIYKVYIFFLLCFIHSTVFGSVKNDSTLISRYRPGFMWFYTGIRPAETEKVRKYDRLIFDVTYNTWNGAIKSLKNNPLSIGLTTNILFDVPITRGNTVSFGWGISHSIFHIRHDNVFVSDFKEGTTIYQPKDTLDAFNKSSLSGNSFSVPLELRFRSKKWEHVKFHIGGKIGYQLNLFNTYKINTDFEDRKVKTLYKDDANRFIYSVHARIGIRNWALYGSYSLNPIFKNSKSTAINLLQFGVSLSLY